MRAHFETVDAYIAAVPAPARTVMKKPRAALRAAAPKATEKISHQMPTLFLGGDVMHFAAFRNHVGLYGAGSAFAEVRASPEMRARRAHTGASLMALC